jgi:hypothetical protein
MSDATALASILAVLAGMGVIAFIIAAALYVLKSIGLTKMAANRGIDNPWLAWIPVADLYIIGTLVGQIRLFNYDIPNLALWFPVACVVGGILGAIPVIGVILIIALLIFEIAVLYELFKQYTDQATLYTVLSIEFCFLWPIFIFTLRDKPMLEDSKPPSVEL